MEQMQFTAVVLLTLLTLKLLLLPNRVAVNPIVNKARWLMTIATALLDIQFLLQYIFNLRAMGVTQAVMLNLVMFIPCSWLLALGVLCLQRQGHITRLDNLVGPLAYATTISIISVAAAIDGQPLLSDTPELRHAEIVGSICYLAMQSYYCWRQMTNLHAMNDALQNYFDHDMGNLLRWMRHSIIALGIMALMVPLLIFVNGVILALFALFFFIFIYYLIDSFCSYVVSSAPTKVQEAEQGESMEKDSKPMPEESAHRVEQAIQRWTEDGGHLHSGITLPIAAEKMHLPRYLISAWLRQKGMRYNDWLTGLRIEEAKRTLHEHPEWSNETIARLCGFADRSQFQKKFKEKTGFSPTEYIHHFSPTA